MNAIKLGQGEVLQYLKQCTTIVSHLTFCQAI